MGASAWRGNFGGTGAVGASAVGASAWRANGGGTILWEPVLWEPVLGEPMVGGPVLWEQVLWEPVLGEPMVVEPVLWEPMLEGARAGGASALRESFKGKCWSAKLKSLSIIFTISFSIIQNFFETV